MEDYWIEFICGCIILLIMFVIVVCSAKDTELRDFKILKIEGTK